MDGQYTYWTLEYYDTANGIRGGGGLGVLAADTRRVADEMGVPFTLITPFYTTESHQVLEDGTYTDRLERKDWRDFGYVQVGRVYIVCNDSLVNLDVVRKEFNSTQIVAITEPNIGVLYQGLSGSDHRLYQEVALGFGGYKALKMLGVRPAIVQLNEVVTVFAALAMLDDEMTGGLDFYQAMVKTREHTLYTNHTLVQAAEAEFSRDQIRRFVLPNIKHASIRRWLDGLFDHDTIKLSNIALEIAGKRSAVSKLHARVADYHDRDGEKIEFVPITNGIDLQKWVLPDILTFYQNYDIIDRLGVPTANYGMALEELDSLAIRMLKRCGRQQLNTILEDYPDQNGTKLKFSDDDFVFTFKRRLVDYKRPELVFTDTRRLREVLEPRGAHYILAGRVHSGDLVMSKRLNDILRKVQEDDYLRSHVHYLADYDERLAYGLSCGCNAALNLPIVGLEACGTSWEKDVANLQLLISTHDGGVADCDRKYHFDVAGNELKSVYEQMERAIFTWDNDFDLEYTVREQLFAYLPIISGARMVKEYLDYMSHE
ncbi:hypothetical protein IJG29_01150 [Candidatus Saccharibacteria bacterium]|nr:hypothetical protein [Candidatus Saccharibacteria bacterium]